MNGFMSPDHRIGRTLRRRVLALSVIGCLGWSTVSAQETEPPLAPPAIPSDILADLFETETAPPARPLTKPMPKPAVPPTGKRPAKAQLIPTGPQGAAPAGPRTGRFGETTDFIPTQFNADQTLVRKASAAPDESVWAEPELEPEQPPRPIRQVQALVPGDGLGPAPGEPLEESGEPMLEAPPAVEFDEPAPANEAPAEEPLDRDPAPSEPASFQAIDAEGAAAIPARQAPQVPATRLPVPTRPRTTVRPAPYTNETEAEFAADDKIHTVAGGDSFWTISRKHYGQGRYSVALAEYNKTRIPKPDKIKPGMKVIIPSINTLEEKYLDLIPGAVARQTAEAPAAPVKSGFFVDANGQPMYRVGEGDTLSNIAQNHLGRSSRWTQIVTLNEDVLPNPDRMKIGMVLRLPDDASDSLVSTP